MVFLNGFRRQGKQTDRAKEEKQIECVPHRVSRLWLAVLLLL